jgi:hypothetical protein
MLYALGSGGRFLLRAHRHHRIGGDLTMTSRLRNWRSLWLAVAVALVLLPALVLAAERRGNPIKPGQFNPDHQTVELFGAIQQGQIDVKLIPKDSTECRVLIENKTQEPLNVKLPEAFAGVPVLAQPGGGGGLAGPGAGGGRNNRWNNNTNNQGFGGGMGGMGGWGGGMGGMGMWNLPPENVGPNQAALLNVPPEKVVKLNVTTVCLEHGKNEPRAAMKYQIKPIDQFTDKKEVYELCRMLGSGRINQRAAQAAAWYLNNNMSWQVLAAKRLRFANGTSRPYFAPQELRAAMQVVAAAVRLAEQRERLRSTPSTGTSLSSR